ncbi:hypothetical protein B0A48_04245 [Cryoendolithus antarcticus]|uniref:Uncharacterized protein n=1 Tax=Cryoendolithus antarcticus TaxID=1507870 RepID=A0A1V8TF72_9PEZI|nr:hypothetical protein B0A48_04245 [Cryoendolithus antarcticus]
MSNATLDYLKEFAASTPSLPSGVAVYEHESDAFPDELPSPTSTRTQAIMDSSDFPERQPSTQVCDHAAHSTASAFLALPPELRVHIYGYCQEERVYYIESEDDVTVTRVFDPLRSVCKLIKDEFDPLYERARDEEVRQFYLEPNKGDDWWRSFVTLWEMLEHRCLAPDSYYTGYNSDGESVDHEREKADGPGAIPLCRYCIDPTGIEVTVNLTISPDGAAGREDELSSWYYLVDEHASSYKVQYIVDFRARGLDQNSGLKPCFGCTVKGYLDDVTGYGRCDTLGGSKCTDAIAWAIKHAAVDFLCDLGIEDRCPGWVWRVRDCLHYTKVKETEDWVIGCDECKTHEPRESYETDSESEGEW